MHTLLRSLLFVALAATLALANGSAPDPYVINSLAPASNGYNVVNEKTQVHPDTCTGTKFHFIVFGQSNSANPLSAARYTPSNSGVLNFNLLSGGLYRGADSLLGAGGGGGGWPSRVADQLITNSKANCIVINTFGIGGTSIAQWASGGILNNRITVAVQRSATVLPITFNRCMVLIDIGETDNALGTSQAAFSAGLSSVRSTLTSAGAGCPIFIALASLNSGSTSSAVRAAQSAEIDNVNVFPLGDFDTIGCSDRVGCTDMTASGMAAAASIAYGNIVSYLNAH